VPKARVQIFADVAANQQRDERADRGVGEDGGHGHQALLYDARVEPFVELFVDLESDVLQVRVDLGLTLAVVNRCRTRTPLFNGLF
jgi:hypothetical protein